MRRNTDFNSLANKQKLKGESMLASATGEINQNTEFMPSGLFGISKENMVLYRIKVAVYIVITLAIIYILFS